MAKNLSYRTRPLFSSSQSSDMAGPAKADLTPPDLYRLFRRMQLTKQQKIYAAVLCIAVVAFCADRWVIGTGDADDVAVPRNNGKSPAASRQPAQRRAAAPATAARAEVSLAKAQGPSVANLANRLQEAARHQKQPLDLENVTDAFQPSAAFLPVKPQVVHVQPTPEPVVVTRDEAAEFTKAHTLQAVMKAGRGVAIVGTKTVAVGQMFEGFRLVAVKDRSAVFRRGTLRVELKLPDEPVAGEILPSGTSNKYVGNELGE